MPHPRLYWCTTRDRSEDWFVVETNARSARCGFADFNGYERQEVHAELVASAPIDRAGHCAAPQPGIADDDDIVRFGGRVIRRDLPRIVYLNGRFFTEGGLQAAIDVMQSAEGVSPANAS